MRVDVADLAAARTWASAERQRMARAAWRAVGPRRGHVVRVVGEPVAADLGVDRARRAPWRARAPRAPAPPRPRPSRSRRARGRRGGGASAGSSLRVDIARMIANAPKQSGASGASAPPPIITSASPSRIARNPSPIAIVPDAQLIPLVLFGPCTPNSIATLQLAAPAKTVSARRDRPRGAPARGRCRAAPRRGPRRRAPCPSSTPTRSGSSLARSSRRSPRAPAARRRR